MPPKVIFVGGGHTHVLALHQLAGRWNGVMPILVSAQPQTPYSGMLPGYIARAYRRDECFIDLEQFAQNFGVELIISLGVVLDANARLLTLGNGRQLPYDILSLNLGGNISQPFTGEGMCPVKPIDDFIRWQECLDGDESLDVVVVGAGSGGVEIALAIDSHRRLSKQQQNRISVVGKTLLAGYPASVYHRLQAEMASRSITVIEGACAVERLTGELLLDDGRRIAADKVVFATPVAAPDWLADSALALSQEGFICVDSFLQSVSHAKVFACGDCANHVNGQQPKSGVIAARQAPSLAHNILAAVEDRRLQNWLPPQETLSIIGIGKGNAVASYGRMAVSGRWVWHWKRYLDKKFMNKFK